MSYVDISFRVSSILLGPMPCEPFELSLSVLT